MSPSSTKAVLTGEYFMLGDYACAEGAIAAGCRFFAGYPITPATEIAERMARRLPQVKGIYIQMEDELASMAAIIGSSCGGVKSMTATSGPGLSLMLENIGLAVIMEVPCVIVNVMRGAPSTGLPTLVGQGDVMQAKWGSHGDYEVIAYSPSSSQEMFDFTIKAFNMSEKYRVPVIILADESVGHLTEKVVIGKPEDIHLLERGKPNGISADYLPYKPNSNGVPPMAIAGDGYFVHMTGLTHDERGYPVITGEAHQKLVSRLIGKVRDNKDDIIEYEEYAMDDAEIAVVAYGITARCALRAVKDARKKGVRAGLLKVITVWPFPEGKIAQLANRVEMFLVPEINAGQIKREVERSARNGVPVLSVNHMGGELITPHEILEVLCTPQRQR